MTIYVGSAYPAYISCGNKDVSAIYCGGTKVWPDTYTFSFGASGYIKSGSVYTSVYGLSCGSKAVNRGQSTPANAPNTMPTFYSYVGFDGYMADGSTRTDWFIAVPSGWYEVLDTSVSSYKVGDYYKSGASIPVGSSGDKTFTANFKGSYTCKLPTPETRESLTFKGWYYGKEGSGGKAGDAGASWSFSFDGYFPTSISKTLYAYWK